MHFKRKGWAVFGLSMVSLLLLTLFPVSKAYAVVVSGEFTDAANINITNIQITQADVDDDKLSDDALDIIDKGGLQALNNLIDAQAQGTYFDREFDDPDREYVRSNNDCNSRIKYQEGEWQLIALHVKPATGGCTGEMLKNDQILNLANPSNLNIKFRWVNQNTMVRVDGRDGEFREEDPTNFQNYFFRINEDGDDRDYVKLISGNTVGDYTVDGDSKGQVTIAGADQRSNPGTPPGTPPGGEDGGEDQRNCEDGAGPTGWITCKILELAGNTLDLLDKMIIGMLNVDETYIEDPGTREIWSRFRNLAYIILVPVILIMVISTALGFEFVSAYTVKKSLPRLVVAVLFIALSFEITKFAIIMINDIGGGMLGFVQGTSDVRSLEDLFGQSLGSEAGLLAMLGGGVAIGVAATAAASGLFMGAVWGLISFLAMAAIAIFLVLLLLAFRQMLIVTLAILSPLAILAWIFPGNDKLWNLWKDSFIKLLLLYPIIMLTLGAGRFFAGVVQSAESGSGNIVDGVLNTILKLAAYVLPYALIPFLFKTAGGLFANVAGMVNNKERGPMDRVRNWGSNRRKSSPSYIAGQTRKDLREKSKALEGKRRGYDRVLSGGLAARGIDERLLGAAKAEQKKEQFTTATQKLVNDTSDMSLGAKTDHFKGIATDANADDYDRQAAMAQLMELKDFKAISEVRTAARADSTGRVAASYNQQSGSHFTELKAMGPPLAYEVTPGETTADDTQHYKTVGAEHHAGMKADAWEAWQKEDAAGAAAAYEKVLVSDQLRPKLAPSVHDRFGNPSGEPRPPSSPTSGSGGGGTRPPGPVLGPPAPPTSST